MRKSKKNILTVLSIVIVLSGVLFWLYLSHLLNIPRRLSNIPYLAEIGEQGASFAYDKIRGYEREQLISVWGEPAESLSNMSEDIWQIDDKTYLKVSFNGKHRVAALTLIRND